MTDPTNTPVFAMSAGDEPMSNVIELGAPATVNAAWDAYAEQMRRAKSDPDLLLDRDFMESLKRAERRWTSLFLIGER